MNVLIACEESQVVCKAFRKRGHNAFSCDILPCSGNAPYWHIWDDVKNLFNDDLIFYTEDGGRHIKPYKWDLIIAHPPCTYLTVTGNKWFKDEFKDRFPDRIEQRERAIDFFLWIVDLPCNKIVIENPVGIMSTIYRKPDQYIQPYYFGDAERKKTCLWLKGLPKLKATEMVVPDLIKCKSGAIEPNWHMKTMNLSKEERSKLRSKTFPGIAAAMAEQWG